MNWAALPRHYRLRAALMEKIASGEWAAHQPIPSERVLGERYNVSRATTRRALDDLANQGYIYREQGRGTFVAPMRKTSPKAQLLGFVEELQQNGEAVTITTIDSGLVIAPGPVAEELHIGANERAAYVRRVISVEAVPLLVAESYVPGFFGGDELVSRMSGAASLYRTLEIDGIIIAHGHQRLRAILLDENTARWLDAPVGCPGLEITRVTFSLEGVPVEMSRGVYRGDRYEYKIDLVRNRSRQEPVPSKDEI